MEERRCGDASTSCHGTNTSSYVSKMVFHDGNTHRVTSSSDKDNSPFHNGKTNECTIIKYDAPYFIQSWTSSKPIAPYFIELMNAYKNKYFSYVYEHLEGSRLIVLLNKELVKYFNNELSNRKSKGVIKAIHAIHSVILNPLSMPNVITEVLDYNEFLSPLFDARYHYNYGNFCFLTKEILFDVLSELFLKTPSKMWLESFLSVLKHTCLEHFAHDGEKSSIDCFAIIAAYLMIGIEGLPKNLYPSLKSYFNKMFNIVSRNNLSSYCLEKAWDKLLLFCEHWVKYTLSYPFLQCLDSSKSKIKFKECENPDISILKNIFIRNRMKYEYVHVEDGYVPCEYPSVISFPRLPKSYPTLHDMQKSGIFWSFSGDDKLDNRIKIYGYCEECEEANCSCLEDYLESEQSSDSHMEVDEVDESVSSDEQSKPSSSAESRPDSAEEDMISEEMSEYYESLIKNNTRSYSFTESPYKKIWEDIKIPDLTNAFT